LDLQIYSVIKPDNKLYGIRKEATENCPLGADRGLAHFWTSIFRFGLITLSGKYEIIFKHGFMGIIICDLLADRLDPVALISTCMVDFTPF